MKATRAYIASLGTTGLLLGFSASLLVVVGTLFAFNAWPGSEVRDAVDSVIVDEDEPFQVAGPVQAALDAAPAALAVTSTPGGAPGSAGAGGDGLGGGTGGGTAPGPGAGGFEQTGGVPGGGTTPDGGGGGGPTISGDGIDTGNSTQPLADNTEQLTGDLGNTVGNVNEDLGNTVTETGQALSDIVRDLPDVKVGDQGISIGD